MTHDALLDTIHRLLALGRSPNEHEAQAAVARAQELLLRHHLSMDDIALQARPEFQEECVWHGRLRVPYHVRRIADVVQRFFFVRCILLSRRDPHTGWNRSVQMFGRPQDLAIGRFVLAYLCETFATLAESYKRTYCAGTSKIRSFHAGLADGFVDALREQRKRDVVTCPAGHALIVIESELDNLAREVRHG